MITIKQLKQWIISEKLEEGPFIRHADFEYGRQEAYREILCKIGEVKTDVFDEERKLLPVIINITLKQKCSSILKWVFCKEDCVISCIGIDGINYKQYITKGRWNILHFPTEIINESNNKSELLGAY
jgi:hypothetical protein